MLIASHYHQQSANAVDWLPFQKLAKRFVANFFSMDIAKTEDGKWIVVDMGAGECSSLPPSLTATDFYRKLSEVSKKS